MSTYTLKELGEEGAPYAMAMLLRSLKEGESFVTYGAIRDELQYQLNIETIFPTHIGYVAGTLMDKILDIYPDAPLINALITRPNGFPGRGIRNYFSARYSEERFRNWDKIPIQRKRKVVARERKIVRDYGYDSWNKINRRVFGVIAKGQLRQPHGEEADGKSPDGKSHGGPAESPEHKRLKTWVSRNPKRIGL